MLEHESKKARETFNEPASPSRSHYNADRPHSSLGYRTPEEFAALNPAAGQSIADVGQGVFKRQALALRPHPRSNRGRN